MLCDLQTICLLTMTMLSLIKNQTIVFFSFVLNKTSQKNNNKIKKIIVKPPTQNTRSDRGSLFDQIVNKLYYIRL